MAVENELYGTTRDSDSTSEGDTDDENSEDENLVDVQRSHYCWIRSIGIAILKITALLTTHWRLIW